MWLQQFVVYIQRLSKWNEALILPHRPFKDLNKP